MTLLILLPKLIVSQTITKLFNEKNLEGWYAFEPESGKHENAEDIFAVKNGLIRLYGSKPGYIMYKKTFHDFILTAEYRWNTDTTFVRKSKKKNSGVTYLVPTELPDTLWPRGIQFQIKEGATGDFIFLHETSLIIQGKQTELGRSVISKRLVDASKPIGEWNTLIITYRDNKLTQTLNDITVNEGINPSIKEGRILIQYEGFPIDFRKVEISEP